MNIHLRNVPENKLKLLYEELELIEDIFKRNILKKAYKRYFEAGIPFIFWQKNMNEFEGDQILFNKYNELTTDIKKTYTEGKSLCFVGNFGRGKSMAICNILKRALDAGYTGIYATMNDIVSVVNSGNMYSCRKDLLNCDILCLDEIDSRHVAQSSSSSSFFGRIMEDILRTRFQNMLPLYMCSNSTDPFSFLEDSQKESIISLWNHVELIPVLGTDYRKKKIK